MELSIAELIFQYGPTTAVLFGLGIFLVKYVWPFITTVWSEQQAERSVFLEVLKDERQAIQGEREQNRLVLEEERKLRAQERKEFLAALENVNKSISSQNEAIRQAVKAITELREELRESKD